MSLSLKYQGQEVSRSKNLSSFKETYQGTESEVDAFISSNLSGISQYFPGKGYLTSWRKVNAGGPFFNVEVEYTVNYDGSFSNESEVIYGEKSAQLSVRNLQLPLEHLKNYKTCWNHYLAGIGSGVTTPYWWDTTSSVIIPSSDYGKYKWVTSESDMPEEPNESGEFWHILEQPKKPGTEYYDFACFVVTETAKYRSAAAAAASTSKRINKVVSPQNDFGLTGEFKLDEANIQYNGEYWIGVNVYTMAADDKGWDDDIYGN